MVFYIVIWFYIMLSSTGFVLSLLQFQKEEMYNTAEIKWMGYLELLNVFIMALFYIMVYQSQDYKFGSYSSTLEKLYKLRRLIGIIFFLGYIAQLFLSIYSIVTLIPTWTDTGFAITFTSIVYLLVTVSVLSKIFYFTLFLTLELTFKHSY